MKILVTGNMGYIGSVLTKYLLNKDYKVRGYDLGLFGGKPLNDQIVKDIRDIDKKDLQGIKAIIHLAAFARNILDDLPAKLIYEVNYHATVQMAKLAKKVGVKRFIFISAMSIHRKPLSIYSKSKLLAEQEINKLKDRKFKVIIIRPGVVYGESPNMRYDTVVNCFQIQNNTMGEINMRSDGTPKVGLVGINYLSILIVKVLESESEVKEAVISTYKVSEIANLIGILK